MISTVTTNGTEDPFLYRLLTYFYFVACGFGVIFKGLLPNLIL